MAPSEAQSILNGTCSHAEYHRVCSNKADGILTSYIVFSLIHHVLGNNCELFCGFANKELL